jgi:hypothetical protein
LVLGGARFPSTGRDPVAFAAPLAHLVATAGQQSDLVSLEPPLPWTAPDPAEPGLWPWPDDRDIDLNAIDGPDWRNASDAPR